MSMDLMGISGCKFIRGSTCGRQRGYALRDYVTHFDVHGSYRVDSEVHPTDSWSYRLPVLNRRLNFRSPPGSGLQRSGSDALR